MVHGASGPPPQTANRERFARLSAQGAPNAEGCRIVGTNRRTGTRWRFGRSITSSSDGLLHYAAVINKPKNGDLVSVFVRRRAGPDRRPASARLDRACDRCGVGPQPGDDQPGAASQPRSGQWAVSAVHGASAGVPARAPPPDPALQLHRTHLRRNPPTRQGLRPAARRGQLPLHRVGGSSTTSRGWHGMSMTPTSTRLLNDLRRLLLDPPTPIRRDDTTKITEPHTVGAVA
jgi:hypothetical protein